jgi:DNA polymerase III subunit gamma/tau
VKFAPASCRYKVYIIDEVHMLTREAFNALLKTLEEPPAHVIFIFATTETHKVPATILSRCQSFDFRRIPLRLIADNLRKIAAADGIRISDTGLAWIAEAGDGSLRDSQSIFDQVISYAGFAIEDKAVEELLGRSDRRFLFLLSEAVLARDAGRCLKIIDEAYYAGLDMKFFYQTLLGHFRNLLLTAISGGKAGDGPLVDLPGDEREKYRAQAEGASRETLQRYLDILMAEEENVRRSQNPRLNLEAILCRLAWLEPMIPIDEVLSRMEGLERRLGEGGASPGGGAGGETPQPENRGGSPGESAPANRGAPAVRAAVDVRAKKDGTQAAGNSGSPPSPAASFPPASGTAPAGGVAEERGGYGPEGAAAPQGDWEAFKAFVKRQDPILCSKIEMGRCLACGEGLLRIGFEKDSSNKDHLFLGDVKEKERELADLCRGFFRREVTLAIETLPFNPAGGANGTNGQRSGNGNGRAAKNQRLQEVRREALSHPFLLKVLDVFPGAEVRDVRLREVSAKEAAAARPVIPPDAEDLSLSAPSEPSDDGAEQD